MGALQQCVSSADVLPRMSDDAARSCLPGVPGIGWRAVQSQSKVLRSGTHCRFPSVKSQRGALASVAKKPQTPWFWLVGFFFFLQFVSSQPRASGCLGARGIGRCSLVSWELGVGGSVPAAGMERSIQWRGGRAARAALPPPAPGQGLNPGGVRMKSNMEAQSPVKS